MEQQTPIPQNQGWSQARAKIHHLPILDFWMGEGGGEGGLISIYIVQDCITTCNEAKRF